LDRSCSDEVLKICNKISFDVDDYETEDYFVNTKKCPKVVDEDAAAAAAARVAADAAEAEAARVAEDAAEELARLEALPQ